MQRASDEAQEKAAAAQKLPIRLPMSDSARDLRGL